MNKGTDTGTERYFPDLFGNQKTKYRLGTAIESGKAAHAYLISGPDGSGKMTLAREIAAALNCEGGRGTLPCHSCNACRRIMAGEFTDVKILKRQKDKMTIGVDEVRLFRDDMFLSATESDYKIYIIDDAGRLTPQAQNALLKVLEEPPSKVVIILLTTSDDAILTTIKSRAQYVNMQKFTPDELDEYFTRGGTSGAFPGGEARAELLLCADGRIGRAKELFGAEGEAIHAMRERTEDFIRATAQGAPYSQLYAATKALPTKRDELFEALENVTVALRDLILLKHSEKAPLLFYPVRERAMEIAGTMSARRLMKIYEIITDSLDELGKNVSVSALITNLGARIKLI